MAPRNEGKIRKFICTTIRPTKLPYVELYEWEKCAKFIADFIDYKSFQSQTNFQLKFHPQPTCSNGKRVTVSIFQLLFAPF